MATVRLNRYCIHIAKAENKDDSLFQRTRAGASAWVSGVTFGFNVVFYARDACHVNPRTALCGSQLSFLFEIGTRLLMRFGLNYWLTDWYRTSLGQKEYTQSLGFLSKYAVENPSIRCSVVHPWSLVISRWLCLDMLGTIRF